MSIPDDSREPGPPSALDEDPADSYWPDEHVPLRVTSERSGKREPEPTNPTEGRTDENPAAE